MAYTIKKSQIIKYPPEKLEDFKCELYEYIDNLNFTLDPKTFLENSEEYIQIAKKRFKKEGWEGDGDIELIWIPPFMLKDEEGDMVYMFETEGEIVWHVKQESDGISWLLMPDKLHKQLRYYSSLKYNPTYGNGIDFSEYQSYLQTIKDKLPKEVYDFAYDLKRHNLNRESLHDSWLESVRIDACFDTKTYHITLLFLGAFRDRKFQFDFLQVKEYKISEGVQNFGLDLITFEIGYEKEQIVFRAQFVGGNKQIEIYCKDLKIEEILS